MSRISLVSTPGNTSGTGPGASGSSSRAAFRCRSGEASNVNRNASGAVSETAMPCGTIAASSG